MVAVSIICPVYKAEKYIHRCVDSVISQTFEDFELLLIDDGSPDNSGKICDEYAQKDKRVRVFHKENGGVASARQLGLEKATGEYTIHVDPDDWVEPNMLEELYAKAKAEDADMVMCDYLLEYPHKQKMRKLKVSNDFSCDTLLLKLLSGKLHGSLCNKLIRREFILSHDIRFVEGLNIGEDLTMCINILSHGAKSVYLNKAFYHYDKHTNPNALTSRKLKIAKEQHDKRLKAFREIIQDRKSRIYRTGVTNIAYWFYTRNVISAEEYEEIYKNEIKSFMFNYNRFPVRLTTTLLAMGLGKYVGPIYRFIKKL